MRQDRLDEAEDMYQKSLAITEVLGMREVSATIHGNLFRENAATKLAL